jgi:hypothetical protein
MTATRASCVSRRGSGGASSSSRFSPRAVTAMRGTPRRRARLRRLREIWARPCIFCTFSTLPGSRSVHAGCNPGMRPAEGWCGGLTDVVRIASRVSWHARGLGFTVGSALRSSSCRCGNTLNSRIASMAIGCSRLMPGPPKPHSVAWVIWVRVLDNGDVHIAVSSDRPRQRCWPWRKLRPR